MQIGLETYYDQAILSAAADILAKGSPESQYRRRRIGPEDWDDMGPEGY
jgi:hypothetical protein